jgi:regulator of protease activity HflC (stomatin/prohibitin superfamily)
MFFGIQAYINVAEGKKRAAILEAEGNAASILAKAKASADAIESLSQVINKNGGADAVALQIAEKYVEAFGKIAKESTTMLLPSNTNDPSSMVASALSIFTNIQKTQASTSKKSFEDDVMEEYKLDDFDKKL